MTNTHKCSEMKDDAAQSVTGALVVFLLDKIHCEPLEGQGWSHYVLC